MPTLASERDFSCWIRISRPIATTKPWCVPYSRPYYQHDATKSDKVSDGIHNASSVGAAVKGVRADSNMISCGRPPMVRQALRRYSMRQALLDKTPLLPDHTPHGKTADIHGLSFIQASNCNFVLQSLRQLGRVDVTPAVESNRSSILHRNVSFARSSLRQPEYLFSIRAGRTVVDRTLCVYLRAR